MRCNYNCLTIHILQHVRFYTSIKATYISLFQVLTRHVTSPFYCPLDNKYPKLIGGKVNIVYDKGTLQSIVAV